MPSPHIHSRRLHASALGGASLLLGCLFVMLAGCAGYQLGHRSLYNANVRTVHVPIVRCDSFRADLGVRLTEAIQKRVEERTPYKVSSDPNADSVLAVRLTTDSKRAVTETNTDEPRQVKTFFTVEASWLDRQGRVLMENRFLPPGEVAFYFAQSADFIPEAGQTITTAHQQAMDRLADHIVNQMEARW